MLLALAKGLHTYLRRQVQGRWQIGYDVMHLPEATAVVVGVGGIGGETARLCSELGMTVLGVDPRVSGPPKGVSELHRPDAIDHVLPRGDFVIMTAPETPDTLGLFDIDRFRLMKDSAFFINVGRGGTVVLHDLVQALREGELRGAGLDALRPNPCPKTIPCGGWRTLLSLPTWPVSAPTWRSAGPKFSSTTASGSVRAVRCATWSTRPTGSSRRLLLPLPPSAHFPVRPCVNRAARALARNPNGKPRGLCYAPGGR